MKLGILTALQIGIPGLVGSYAHYHMFGHFNWVSQILIWFLAINFIICFWELALFYFYADNMKLHNDRLKAGFYKADKEGQKLRAAEPLIFFKDMTWAEAFHPKSVAAIWIDYGRFDLSYCDKHSYGYNIDVGNGHSTFFPTLFLFISLFTPIFSAQITGIIGIIVFYQKWYGTLLYLFAFFNCQRYKQCTLGELIACVFCTNGVWFTLPVIGFFAHIDLILTDSFAMLQ